MNLGRIVTDPAARMRLHTWLAWLWLALTLVTTSAAMRWPDHPWLLAWITFMSGYALTARRPRGPTNALPSAKEEA